jgi:hypothetical protein
MWLIILFAAGLSVVSWSHYQLAKRLAGQYMGGGYSLTQESWACIISISLIGAMVIYSGLSAIMFALGIAGLR